MDFNTTIVAIVIVLFGILPFILINRKSKKIEKKLLKNLTALAQKGNYIISKYEIFSNSIIGMDTNRKIFFYIKQSQDQQISQQINLSEIKNCRFEKSNKVIKDKDESYTALNRVEMYFESTVAGKLDNIIEIYNAEFDGITLSNEVQVAEKWVKFIKRECDFLNFTIQS